ncbi:hypothetical protein OUZ56_033659 [Daphnia magna]|uniref:Uncharacterized protein n=1 Tax=Daphnia magna TaxID=35525 RepID=A0ABQ9ZY47_9CRUS|nr:hypothetical protein OUZ56_033659 [Daphnia magna]
MELNSAIYGLYPDVEEEESGKIFLNTFLLREAMDWYLLQPLQFELVFVADRGALLVRKVTPQHPALLVHHLFRLSRYCKLIHSLCKLQHQKLKENSVKHQGSQPLHGIHWYKLMIELC